MVDALRRILVIASETAGVDFTRYRASMVERRVGHRQLLRQRRTRLEYLALLESDPGERWRLIDALLIKTTRAFRDPETWVAMSERAFPELFARAVRRGASAIRAWVAGCSTGEEAYAYALALLAARARAEVRVDLSVLATDVDLSALEQAARGAYARSTFAHVPIEIGDGELLADAGGRVTLSERVRSLVTFARHDLSDPAAAVPVTVFASFDLVSCCNVMLYFDEPTRAGAFARLIGACEPGAVLVLGEAERPPREHAGALLAIGDRTHAYRVGSGNYVRRKTSG